MQIEGDGVGKLLAFDQVFRVFAPSRQRSEGPINMEPKIKLIGKRPQGRQIINRARIHGADRPHHTEGFIASGDVGLNHLAASRDINLERIIDRNRAEAVAPKAHQLAGAIDPAMRFGAAIDTQTRRVFGLQSMLANIEPSLLVSGDDHTIQICHRSTRDQKPRRRFRIPNQL